MKPLKLLTTFLLAHLLIWSTSIKAQVFNITVKSPDSKVTAAFFINNGKLNYQVKYKGQPVIDTSRMGLIVNELEYGTCRSLHSSKTKTIDEQFAWRGTHRIAHHLSSACTITTEPLNDGRSLSVDVRVFNDGVAFRYVIKHQQTANITRELTSFTVPGESVAWWQGDIHNYEGEYQQSRPATIKKGQPIGLPMTIVLPKKLGYAALNEANVNSFAGMHLAAGGSNNFETVLDGNVALNDSLNTPWRVIGIGEDLNTLVNSDIIASLSPKPDQVLFPLGFDTQWIKPGKSVWSWMTANRAVTPENMRKFSDLAAQCNIPYNLVDDGWGKWHETGKDEWQILKELIDYSAAKNVRIWVWAAYPDNNGIKGLKDSVYMVNFFKKCREVGVAGVKIDFMSSESQNMMAFYNRASREAARMKLMVDFHGAGKPSGQSRTWPNELTREAVRGLEYSGDTDWPTHNTIIPFTRFLAGHGDYTPLSTEKFVSSTTLAHQVATAVAFTSPFLCLGADPAELLKSEALPFVRQIPSVWDETVVLPPSAIGEVCAMARRSGTKWFLAVLNNKQAKTISVPLWFLNKKNYTCQALGNKLITNKLNGKVVGPKENIEVELLSGDGIVAVFESK
jgi:alpha-glucosidase